MASKVRLYHPQTGDPSPELWPLDAADWQASGWLTEPPVVPPETPRTRRRGTPEPASSSEAEG